MMKIVCLALFVTLASATKPFALRGVVTPVEPCGGSGTPVQLRVQGCEGAPPCTIVPNTDTMIEGDFIPSANSPLAKFRLVAETSVGPITVTDGEIGALTGGQLYTAGQAIRISNALAGQSVIVILDVYDAASGRIEICVKAPMNVAAAP